MLSQPTLHGAATLTWSSGLVRLLITCLHLLVLPASCSCLPLPVSSNPHSAMVMVLDCSDDPQSPSNARVVGVRRVADTVADRCPDGRAHRDTRSESSPLRQDATANPDSPTSRRS